MRRRHITINGKYTAPPLLPKWPDLHILWADGIHDDYPALTDIFKGIPFIDGTAGRSTIVIVGKHITITGGIFAISETLNIVDGMQVEFNELTINLIGNAPHGVLRGGSDNIGFTHTITYNSQADQAGANRS